MAEPNGSGGMGFLMGIVVILLLGIIWYLFTGGDLPGGGGGNDATITIDLPEPQN
ncbi:hypothetical protein [Halodurantibacterium flavum]|uniref:Uncharacterized protein n=1 Tax=Halodurantibacterium flavum TaxID=1382802 RepID=A0ABW4S2T2_9RHOB